VTTGSPIERNNELLETVLPLTSEDKARFAYFGVNAKILPPLRILNPQNVVIGDYTAVALGSDGVLHPCWTDFRGSPGVTAPNQDAYTHKRSHFCNCSPTIPPVATASTLRPRRAGRPTVDRIDTDARINIACI